MKNSLIALTQIADTLYKSDNTFIDLYNSCQNYKSVLLDITEFALQQQDNDNDIFTDSGRAIGTEWAIRCVEDIMRTYKYCNGLYKAVFDASKAQQEPVRILYAGPGPFATLVLPLITRFTPQQIQFDMLEINPESAALLKKVIAHFDAGDYINEFEITDATTYKVPEPEGVNILVSETMQAALYHEPQVTICYNLLPQLPAEAVMIPKEISLSLYAGNDDKRQQHKTTLDGPGVVFHDDLGHLFTLSKEEIQANHEKINAMGSEARFEPVELQLPDDTHRKYHNLMIATSIIIYDEETEIKLEESGLTALRQLQPLNPMMQTVKALRATYMSGEFPGLDFQLNP